MPNFYAQADAMLFSLKDEENFNITIPGKVQSYLACGKPIIAMINGEAAKLIKNNDAGFVCKAGDSLSLAKKIKKMSSLGEKSLNKFSINSLHCYKEFFDRTLLINKAEKTISKMIQND